ncbi:MAG: choice-of-anchor D domain-containing protein [Acidobacteriia bacterium]|nr:choice-of-anchor D domain-containing protein [Terriglobia bacterium]
MLFSTVLLRSGLCPALFLLLTMVPGAFGQRFQATFDHHELRMRESASSTLCNSFSNNDVAESRAASASFPLQLVAAFPCENSLQASTQIAVNFPADPMFVVAEGDRFRLENPTTIRPVIQGTVTLLWRTAARSIVETTISSAIDDGLVAHSRCGYREVTATVPVAAPSYQAPVSSECALNRLPGGQTSLTIESNITIKLKRNVELDEVKYVVLTVYRLQQALGSSLGVEPAELSFTASAANPAPAPQFMQISNTGGGSLEWSAAALADQSAQGPAADELAGNDAGNWLSVSQATGSLGEGTSTTLEVRVSTDRFESGRRYTGKITVTSSAGGAAKTVGVTAELLPDIAVDRIEVTQVVQGSGNPVPLVAGKPAIARVFVRLDERRTNPLPLVTGLLRRSGGGERAPWAGTITAPKSPDRNRMLDSLNFEIPGDWIQGESLELQAEVSLASGREERTDNNTLVESVPVGSAEAMPETFRIAYLRFCYEPPGLQRTCAGPGRFGELHQAIPAVFPLPAGSVRFDYLGGGLYREPLRRSTTHSFLQKLRRWDVIARQGGMQYDQLFAWLPEIVTPSEEAAERAPAGRADMRRVGGNGRSGRVAFGQESIRALGTPKAGFLMAHQIAHNLGLQHTNLPDSCGAVDTMSRWPYASSSIQETGIDVGPRLIQSPAGITPAVDMMSHCWLSGPAGAWLSPDSFARLQAGKLQSQAQAALGEAGAPVERDGEPGEFVMVSGTVRRDGSGGSLLPMFTATADSATDAAQTGSHCIQFSGEGVSKRFCFTPDFMDDDDGQAVEEDSFTLVIPRPAGARQLVLLREENMLASLEAGTSAPVVTISIPQAMDRWEPGSRELVWSASVEGGRPLSYAVLYSSDGGSRWTPLEVDWAETSIVVDTGELNGSTVLFRVIASDGWSQGESIVGPVTVEQSPALAAATQQLAFGKVVVGSTTTREMTLRSSGNAQVLVAEAPAGHSAFTAEFPSPPFRIPAGGEEVMKVRFAPLEAGLVQSRLRLESNGTGSPVEVLLEGKGVSRPEPDAAFTPAVIDFGFVAVGQTSEALLQVRNLGPGELKLESSSFSDAQFTLVAPAFPVPIAAGGQQPLTVRFRPATGGTKTASLLLSTNDPDRLSLSVPLRGEATTPQSSVVQLSAAALDFGTVNIGQSKDLTLLVTNGGNVALQASGLNVSNVVFQAGPSLFTVAPGAQMAVTVRFLSANGGAQAGIFSMTTNDPERRLVQIPVSGVAVAPVGLPAMDVNPASLLFVAATLGQSRELTLTVRNSGAALLRVESVSSSNAAFRAVAPLFPFSLQPGAQQDVTVRFTPSSVGAQVASLGVTTNDPTVPTLAIVASGSGVAASPQGAVLQVDDGTFEDSASYPGGDAYFLNRLTPPRYPATLRAVQIYFPVKDGLPLGDAYTVLTAVNPTGSATLAQVLLRTTNARLVVHNRFVEIVLPQPVTIQSGDFLVGFVVGNNEGVKPIAIDTSSVPQNRSYASRNGLEFVPIQTIGGQQAGNLAIRARVDLAP